ncbi:hypothetical protein [Clostridium cadaveris]|uniref:hypothetical protein n=1 Tax=Clostridium cadaveris TaxID=1529 RepID=UPI0039969657
MKIFGKELKFNGKDIALKENIPTKLSQLQNDSGFTANALKQTVSPTQPSSPSKGDVWIQI